MTNQPSTNSARVDSRDTGGGAIEGEELLEALNELLEAERAGVKVSRASGQAANDPGYVGLMKAVERDEARWCAMLSRHLKQLEGTPSSKTGTFRDKAMAIGDLAERLAFLNRGQAWVVRKLEALVDRLGDIELRRDLLEMLESHRVNINRTDEFLMRGDAAS